MNTRRNTDGVETYRTPTAAPRGTINTFTSVREIGPGAREPLRSSIPKTTAAPVTGITEAAPREKENQMTETRRPEEKINPGAAPVKVGARERPRSCPHDLRECVTCEVVRKESEKVELRRRMSLPCEECGGLPCLEGCRPSPRPSTAAEFMQGKAL